MSPRIALLALAVAALAACSTSSNSSNSTNPLAGVTIVAPPSASPSPVPTASPTASPTPVPNATPSPSPTPGNVLIDGGFEAEGAANMTFSAWTPCSYAHPYTKGTPNPVPALTSNITDAVISASDPSFTVGKASAPIATVTPSANSGTYAALTYTGTGAVYAVFPPATSAAFPSPNYPNDGANGICQTFVVPLNAALSLYVNEGGNESTGYGDQEAMLFAGTIADLATASPIEVFSELNVQTAASPAGTGWVSRGPYNITQAPYGLTPGSTATLFLGTFDGYPSSTYGEYMFVDDVSVFGTPVTAASARRFKR